MVVSSFPRRGDVSNKMLPRRRLFLPSELSHQEVQVTSCVVPAHCSPSFFPPLRTPLVWEGPLEERGQAEWLELGTRRAQERDTPQGWVCVELRKKVTRKRGRKPEKPKGFLEKPRGVALMIFFSVSQGSVRWQEPGPLFPGFLPCLWEASDGMVQFDEKGGRSEGPGRRRKEGTRKEAKTTDS